MGSLRNLFGNLARHPLVYSVAAAVVAVVVGAVIGAKVVRTQTETQRVTVTQTSTVTVPTPSGGQGPAASHTASCQQRGKSPSSVAAAEEPNDTRMRAFGPVVGASEYSGAIETDNDADWYLICVKPDAQVAVTVDLIGCRRPAGGDCANLFAELRDPTGAEIPDLQNVSLHSVDEGSGTINYTAQGADHLYLLVTGDKTSRYTFRVEPSSALSPQP